MPVLSSQRDRAAQQQQQRRREATEAAPAKVTTTAHDAARNQARLSKAQLDIQRLRQLNPDFRDLSHVHTTEYYLVTLLAAAVYGADVFLFRPVVQYIAGKGLPPSLGWVAVFVVPAIIILAELGISTSRENGRERVREGLPASVAPWILLSWLFTVAMPALVVASYLAAFRHLSPSLQLALVIGLACLALGCHAAVIWGGPHALEAKSYFAYRFRQGHLEREIERANEAYDKAAQAAGQLFAHYVQNRDQLNNGLPPEQQIPLPMFDAITVRTINEVFARQVIQTPPTSASAGDESQGLPAAQSQPPAPPQRGEQNNSAPEFRSESVVQPPRGPQVPAEAENDYLRTILTQRLRDEESEVKP